MNNVIQHKVREGSKNLMRVADVIYGSPRPVMVILIIIYL